MAGGRALSRLDDGRVVFVDGALPGEVVEVVLSRDRSDFAEAQLVRVVEPVPARWEPQCPYRLAGCGGCDWMHLESTAQLPAKVGIVVDAFARTGRLPADDIAEMISVGGAVPSTRYRTTVRVVGGPDGRVGFRAAGSHDVVGVDDCPVAVDELVDALAQTRIEPDVELTLRVSAFNGARTAWWSAPKRRRQSRKPRRPVIPADIATGRGASLVERVAGAELRVSAASFFQASHAGAELLVDAVQRAAPEAATAEHAVDAYGGVGLFAATVLADAAHVTLVETSPTACDDARHNLSCRNATVQRADVGAWQATGRVDLVIADPARDGLRRRGVAALAAAGAPIVVLVSCDPVAGARDVRGLIDAGYRIDGIEVLDLFPQTHHLEVVSRLVRE